jgi:signal transduction histidine kinase/CheY-like chemotaxis protein
MKLALAKSTKAQDQQIYTEEHRIIHKQGGTRWGLFNLTWTFDKITSEFVYIAQIIDITDKKQIDQIKSEFISTVSHELRTPLTSIKGALGLIEMSSKTKLEPSVLRLIEIARTNANRLADIVNDILDLEKISSGEIDFNIDTLNIADVINASVCEMMPFAVTHHSEILTDLPDQDLNVAVDRGRTMQVLAKLVSNACKYSDENSVVTVKAEKLNDLAIIYVQNFGPGVPDSFKSRIFDAFSQADGSDTRAKGGTGLGLNITRQIVWRQGGDIGFETVPNGPTVFWFTCPLAKDQIVKVSDQTEGVNLTSDILPDAQKRLRILHLEDDEDFAEVIRVGLSPVADVYNVTRLKQAREMLNAGPLDVIIIDWTIPDGDGRDLISDIKQSQPAAKIVSLTSESGPAQDSRVAVTLIKSQTELAHIIACVTDRTKKAS